MPDDKRVKGQNTKWFIGAIAVPILAAVITVVGSDIDLPWLGSNPGPATTPSTPGSPSVKPQARKLAAPGAFGAYRLTANSAHQAMVDEALEAAEDTLEETSRISAIYEPAGDATRTIALIAAIAPISSPATTLQNVLNESIPITGFDLGGSDRVDSGPGVESTCAHATKPDGQSATICVRVDAASMLVLVLFGHTAAESKLLLAEVSRLVLGVV